MKFNIVLIKMGDFSFFQGGENLVAVKKSILESFRGGRGLNGIRMFLEKGGILGGEKNPHKLKKGAIFIGP